MLVKVKAFPNSNKEKIIKEDKETFFIYLKEKPEKGKANRRLIEILKEYFQTEKVKLIKGRNKRNKIFEIEG